MFEMAPGATEDEKKNQCRSASGSTEIALAFLLLVLVHMTGSNY